jgi:tripartite-type tricarboxylate transporter receptor subunit TctC
MKVYKNFVSAALVTAAFSLSSASIANAGFYDGKDVTVIVNAGAGGGLTRNARTLSGFMKKYLGKDTNMIIKNVAGGGGVKGFNFLTEKTKANGLTVLFGSGQQMAQLLKLRSVRFDFGNMAFIGASESNYITIARSDFKPGIKKASDILNVKKMIAGGRGTTDGLGIWARLPLMILGIDTRYVTGYRGQPKLNAAIRAKEIGLLATGGIGYFAFYADTIVKSGEAIPLYFHAARGKNGKYSNAGGVFGKVKHFSDFYKETHNGKLPTGPLWEAYEWLSMYNTRPFGMYAMKAVGDARISELRNALRKTAADSAYRAAYKKQNKTDPNYLIGAEGEFLMSEWQKISPGALAGLKKLTAKKKKKGGKKKK